MHQGACKNARFFEELRLKDLDVIDFPRKIISFLTSLHCLLARFTSMNAQGTNETSLG
jgi:hypothetical protein